MLRVPTALEESHGLARRRAEEPAEVCLQVHARVQRLRGLAAQHAELLFDVAARRHGQWGGGAMVGGGGGGVEAQCQ